MLSNGPGRQAAPLKHKFRVGSMTVGHSGFNLDTTNKLSHLSQVKQNVVTPLDYPKQCGKSTKARNQVSVYYGCPIP